MNAIDVSVFLIVWILDLAVEDLGLVQKFSVKAEAFFVFSVHWCHDVVVVMSGVVVLGLDSR